MLILFDIDMTLLKTNGAGRRAMAATGQKLFSPDFAFEGVDFAGRLDPLIIRELLAANGVAPTPDNLAAMRAGYIEAFAATAAESIEALPGAVELVRAIVADASATPGVLTGNFPETGTFKLRTIGLDPAEFRVQVWGDDSPHDPPARGLAGLMAAVRQLQAEEALALRVAHGARRAQAVRQRPSHLVRLAANEWPD